MAQDDFRSTVILFHGALDLNGSSGELANVAYPPEVALENDDGEGTGFVILAEVEKRDTVFALFHMHHSSSDALSFSQVVAGFSEGHAVGGEGMACGEHCACQQSRLQKKP
jgi:hypothetical protein